MVHCLSADSMECTCCFNTTNKTRFVRVTLESVKAITPTISFCGLTRRKRERKKERAPLSRHYNCGWMLHLNLYVRSELCAFVRVESGHHWNFLIVSDMAGLLNFGTLMHYWDNYNASLCSAIVIKFTDSEGVVTMDSWRHDEFGEWMDSG